MRSNSLLLRLATDPYDFLSTIHLGTVVISFPGNALEAEYLSKSIIEVGGKIYKPTAKRRFAVATNADQRPAATTIFTSLFGTTIILTTFEPLMM